MRCAQFYVEVFGLTPLNRPKDDNFYLSDGRVTLMIFRGGLRLFAQDPARTGLDISGSRSKRGRGERDMEFLMGEPTYAWAPLGMVLKAEARLKLFRNARSGVSIYRCGRRPHRRRGTLIHPLRP